MFASPAFAAAYTPDEVVRHNTARSCWMAIEGKVYDVTAYLDEHRTKYDYDMLKWCGTEATRGWQDKDGRNEAHKRKAALLLGKYLIGDLAGK